MLLAAVKTPSFVIVECIPKVRRDRKREGSNKELPGNISGGSRFCRYIGERRKEIKKERKKEGQQHAH